ncbi:MAG: MmgE/PrpD family protein [Chloroflexi bacterium]|nr:MmgE/PrpD family protein [Chloroflexota bacterium]
MTTRALAEYAAGLRYDDLPAEVRQQAKLLFLDFVGIAIFASAKTPWGRSIVEYAKRGVGDATIVGGGAKTSPTLAALANGTTSLGFELEDIYRPAFLHPGPPINAAALAAAEVNRASGRDLLTAIVAAYEVMTRVALAGMPRLLERGCHATAHTGVFGAAVAAGRLAGLDATGLLNALGLAGVRASGLKQAPNEGVTARRLYGGLPAESGVQAVELTQLGFTGPERVLEGEMGFYNAYADGYDPEKLTGGLGSQYRILDVAVKPYSTCALFHSALDAMLAIRREHEFRADHVAEIVGTIALSSPAHAGHDVPSITGAQFRLPYCLAVALHEGSVNAPQFTEAKIKDPAILATMRQVRTEFYPGHPTEMPGHVVVKLVDGRTLEQDVPYPTGSPLNPMSEADRRDKFRGLAATVFANDRVAAIEQAVGRLETLSSATELADLLR